MILIIDNPERQNCTDSENISGRHGFNGREGGKNNQTEHRAVLRQWKYSDSAKMNTWYPKTNIALIMQAVRERAICGCNGRMLKEEEL